MSPAQKAGLLDGGRTYVKLSGPYISSRAGPPTYSDIDPVASELVRAAPERVLWEPTGRIPP